MGITLVVEAEQGENLKKLISFEQMKERNISHFNSLIEIHSYNWPVIGCSGIRDCSLVTSNPTK